MRRLRTKSLSGKVLRNICRFKYTDSLALGKEAAEDERKAAMSTAEKFIDQKGYPKETSIEVLPETGESTYFKEYFSDWQHVEESAGLKHFNLRPPKVRLLSMEGC